MQQQVNTRLIDQYPKMKYEASDNDWPWVWGIRFGLDWKKGLSTDEIEQIEYQQSKPPGELLPYLFVGHMFVASQEDRLQECGITHVLNVAGSGAAGLDEEGYAAIGIKNRIIEAEDEEGYPLLENHFENAFKFIKEAKESGGKCLIHCEAGLNRSGLLVCASAMELERLNVIDCVLKLRTRRSIYALFNDSFQEQLVAFARYRGLLGPKPGEAGCVVEEAAPKKDD